jgi:hypothetical protein
VASGGGRLTACITDSPGELSLASPYLSVTSNHTPPRSSSKRHSRLCGAILGARTGCDWNYVMSRRESMVRRKVDACLMESGVNYLRMM